MNMKLKDMGSFYSQELKLTIRIIEKFCKLNKMLHHHDIYNENYQLVLNYFIIYINSENISIDSLENDIKHFYKLLK